jgi:hypothetical protein
MVICVKNVIVEEEKEHPGGKPIPCMLGVLHHLMRKSEETVEEVLGKHLDLREGVGQKKKKKHHFFVLHNSVFAQSNIEDQATYLW